MAFQSRNFWFAHRLSSYLQFEQEEKSSPVTNDPVVSVLFTGSRKNVPAEKSPDVHRDEFSNSINLLSVLAFSSEYFFHLPDFVIDNLR